MYNEKTRKYLQVLFLTLAPLFLIFSLFFFPFLVYILWPLGSNSGTLQSGGGKGLWLARLTRTATKELNAHLAAAQMFPSDYQPAYGTKAQAKGPECVVRPIYFSAQEEIKNREPGLLLRGNSELINPGRESNGIGTVCLNPELKSKARGLPALSRSLGSCLLVQHTWSHGCGVSTFLPVLELYSHWQLAGGYGGKNDRKTENTYQG